MLCKNCEKEIRDGSEFCKYCGQKVEKEAEFLAPRGSDSRLLCTDFGGGDWISDVKGRGTGGIEPHAHYL